MDLSGRVALVTGGGRGLGLAHCRALADAGARVLINDVDDAAIDAAVAGILAKGGTAMGVCAPVGSSQVAQHLVDTAVEAFGGLDILVANAGILRDKVLWKMTDEDFDAVIQVHLRGTFTCARAAVIHMRERNQGGRLILTGSPTGQYGNFGQTNYAAAKAGIVGMARTWALECGKAAITVNAIVPIAATEMTATIPAYKEHVGRYLTGDAPLPDWLRKGEGLGTPEDVAELVVFLSSPAAAQITGQCIGIGGDRMALWSHPAELAIAYHDAGWTAGAIEQIWRTTLGRYVQSVGMPAPQPPAA